MSSVFNFILILCEFHSMHPNPIHLCHYSYSPYILATTLQMQTKINQNKTAKTRKKKHIAVLWKLCCVRLYHTVYPPFYPIFIFKYSFQEVIVLVWGFWLLLHYLITYFLKCKMVFFPQDKASIVLEKHKNNCLEDLWIKKCLI